jgi:hypothetical protein
MQAVADRAKQSLDIGLLCSERTAEDFRRHDIRQLMDGLRLGSIVSYEGFKKAWEAILSSVQNAVLNPGVQPKDQADLISLLSALKEKWNRIKAVGSIPPGKLPWPAKRTFIQNVCGWAEEGALDATQFREDHKDLQMLSALYKYTADDESPGPYGRGGVFNDSDGPPNRKPNNGLACSGCGKQGHVVANCHGKGKGQQKTCFKCEKPGHIKVNCPN